jgi:metal-dependent amidase/aminoacylase/carboxypeptidase family protein
MVRGEITCTVPEAYDWTRFGASGAILTINDIINKVTAIELPSKPRTSIVMGSVKGGQSFNTVATHATLRFEVRSESPEMVKRVSEQVEDIVAEASSRTESEVSLDIIARRQPGGIPFAHPLSRSARRILDELGVGHRENPSTSELSAFIDRDIPAVTVGITSGEHVGESRETVDIEPMSTGLAQIVAMLVAIDGGFCDEHQ